MKRILFTALIFILLLGVVYGQESVTASPMISVCGCSTGSVAFTVLNTDPSQEVRTYVVGDQPSQTVENVPVTKAYKVLLSGRAAKYVTASPTEFSLTNGKEQKVVLTYNIPCEVRGRQRLTITLQTDTPRRFDMVFDVQQCENFELTPKVNLFEGCPCQPALFEYILKNTGGFTEQYTIGVDQFYQYAAVSENPVVLAPRESRSVLLKIQPPCDVSGAYQGTLSVTAEQNQLIAETPYYLNILACYDYTIETGELVPQNTTLPFQAFNESYSICEGQSKSIPLRFTNTAEVPNTYNLKLRAPRWAKLDKAELTLAQDQSRTVHIDLDAPERLSRGFEFILDIDTEIGDTDSRLKIPVEVQNCFIPRFELPKLGINYSEQYSQYSITNTGEKQATYTLSILGVNWAEIVEPKVTVASGSTATFTVHTYPFGDTQQGEYVTTLIAQVDGSEYQQPFSIVLKERQVMSALGSFLSLYKGYLVVALIILVLLFAFIVFAVKQKKVLVPKPAERIAKVHKELKKPKLEKKERVVRQPSKWIITLLFIIFLALGAAAVGYFGYQWYKDKQPVEVVAPPIEGVTPTFVIEEPEENITEPEITELPEELPLATRIKNWFCAYYVYVAIAAAVLGALAILVFWSRINLKWILGLIAVIVIIALVISGYLVCLRPAPPVAPPVNITEVEEIPQVFEQDEILKVLEEGKYGYDTQGNVVDTETEERLSTAEFLELLEDNRDFILDNANVSEFELNQTIAALEMMAAAEPEEPAVPEPEIPEPEVPVAPEVCDIELQQGTSVEINLSESFTDPDLDKLSFWSTQPEHLLVTIEGEMAELAPAEGFIGVDFIEFTADDSKGGRATSGELTVCVKEAELSLVPAAMSGMLRVYAPYILGGLAILIILILLIRYHKPVVEFFEPEPPKPPRKKKR